MDHTKSYFFQSFLIILLAGIFFIGIKEVLPKQLFSEKSTMTKNVLIDSMLIEAVQAEENNGKIEGIDSITDSLDLKYGKEIVAEVGDTLKNQDVSTNSNLGVIFPSDFNEDYSGNQYLASFFEKLYQLETEHNGNVRIAYFGDSMTDGDFIVQDLRSSYQSKYGGEGVGFVSITSESAGSRSSVIHQFSENWKMQSYLNVKNPIRPFGVNGHVFFANDSVHDTWVKFKASKNKNINALFNPTLFYGNAGNENGKIVYQVGLDTLSKKLIPTRTLNTIQLSSKNLQSLKVSFRKSRSIPIYGLNFDNGQGVHVDNFSQRGNSGIPISKFDVNLMQAFQKKLGYDLIVLHYGTNVLNYGTNDFSWYDKSMSKTVERLHQGFPGAVILIISTADKSSKYGTLMKTDIAVEPLTVAQRNYAEKTKSGYVNLYKLMGGNGSMVKWVEEVPPLANKDYTHFNFKGSKKIAGLLFEHLEKGYQKYKGIRPNVAVASPTKPIRVRQDSLIKNQEKTDE